MCHLSVRMADFSSISLAILESIHVTNVKNLIFSFMRPACNVELLSSILLAVVLPIQKHLFCHHREPLSLKRLDLSFGLFPPRAHCQTPDKRN